MNKVYLKLLSLLLAVLVVVGMLPVNASAEQTTTGQTVETVIATVVSDPVYNAPGYMNEDAAAAYVTEKMQLREQTIVVNVCADTADYSAVHSRIMDKACDHTAEPTAGDYLQWHRDGYRVRISYDPRDTGPYYYTFTYTVGYYTTAQQEAGLDDAIDILLEELELDGKTDYEKVAGVYDYMSQNISYDFDNLNDADYKLKYTAYAALINKTAVCQGYANLFYRLMLELDVDCRIITGIGNGGGHAWNIVKLDGKYYNLDATWDSQWVQAGWDYRYFLRCEENFEDHTRDAEFETVQFHTQYPMDTVDYNPEQTPQVIYGDGNGDGVVNGDDATLLLQYAAGWNVQIDPSAADANGDGVVNGDDATLLLQYAAGWNVILGAA